MLAELRVQNLAIFEHVALELGNGLVVFTGETGAGKSLLVEAMELLMGARADGSIVRAGSRAAMVEGRFLIRGAWAETLRKMLAAEELLDSDEELIVAREVRADGRSVARINGRMVRVSLLRSLAQHLIDLHGQSSHLSLLRPGHQLELLDRYGKTERLAAELRTLHARLNDRLAELRRLQQQAREMERARDLMEFELREIEQTLISEEEEAELVAERRRLAHARTLADQTARCLALLDGDDSHEVASAAELLGMAYRILLDIARIDQTQCSLAERLGSLCAELDEIVRELRRYGDRCEFDPDRLEELERQLAALERLKRKYGPSLSEVAAYADRLRRELAELGGVSEREPALRQEIAAMAARAKELAQRLSRARRRAARALAAAVRRELATLGFLQTHFEVALEAVNDQVPLPDGSVLMLAPTGAERAAFLLAANPGEPLRPLSSVASGGETARLMLALKAALAEVDPVPTLVFDELDQGVGGRAGAVVGRRLKALAATHQVLCVTHLPQVAAYADQHFAVTKQLVRRRTRTSVRELRDEERIEELAAMLGSPSEANRASARELLSAATCN